jgi:hypothetical protein
MFGFRNGIEVVDRVVIRVVTHSARKESTVVPSCVKDKGELYSLPQLRTRTFEQAAVFLTGHAWIGNEGARDLLELLFPPPPGEPTAQVKRDWTARRAG